MLQVSPLGTALSHQVPASLHDPNHTPGSARSHQESSSLSDAHAPDARWGPPKFLCSVHRSSRLVGAHDQCHQVTPVRHDANEQAWIILRRHLASRQPHVAEVHVDSSVGEPLVKPRSIGAGLSKRWWTQELVLKNGVYSQSGKEPLRIGVPYQTVLMEGNYRSANHMTRPSRPATEFRMPCGGTETPDSCQLRGKIINFP